ncbi:MAG: hypothetical protein JW821_05760 [Deltaproteobacteria bacterium]|nr:hypothetical protein [Deltaproteobacteria bacterium]
MDTPNYDAGIITAAEGHVNMMGEFKGLVVFPCPLYYGANRREDGT